MSGTSRISREVYVRFCEGLGVKLPGSTRQNPSATLLPQRRLSPAADKGYLAAMPEMGQMRLYAVQH